MTTALPAYFSTGKGPAVLLLHCSLSSKNQWRGLSNQLADSFRSIAPDLYGYGETPMPEHPEAFTLLDEVKLLRSLVDAILPDGPFQLVGHSYGGAVALAFCHYCPERVRSLTLFEPVSFHLLDPQDPGLAPVAEMVQELETFLAEGRRSEAARTFVDYWGGAGTFAAYPPRVQNDFARRTDKLLLDFTALTRTPLTRNDYRELEIPTTLIAGRSSKLPALHVAQTLSETLPQCKTIWMETGHMGPVTDPDLVNPVIEKSLF
jgi:pimeloyl-ACP methyl ester carboxylesterase